MNQGLDEKEPLARGYKVYGRVHVFFNLDICQHSANCTMGHPEVFNIKRKPWILIENGRQDIVGHRQLSVRALQYILRRTSDGRHTFKSREKASLPSTKMGRRQRRSPSAGDTILIIDHTEVKEGLTGCLARVGPPGSGRAGEKPRVMPPALRRPSACQTYQWERA